MYGWPGVTFTAFDETCPYKPLNRNDPLPAVRDREASYDAPDTPQPEVPVTDELRLRGITETGLGGMVGVVGVGVVVGTVVVRAMVVVVDVVVDGAVVVRTVVVGAGTVVEGAVVGGIVGAIVVGRVVGTAGLRDVQI